MRRRTLSLLSAVLLIALLHAGCSGDYVVRSAGPGRYVVTLIPSDGSTDGDGYRPPAAPPTGGSSGSEPTNPPAPGNDNPPPGGVGGPPDLPDSVDDQAREIRERYGITMKGYPTERDVENLLVACRQFRPEETSNVTINYSRGNRSGGVMGCYSPSGRMEIYDHRNLHTVFHELAHHITLYPRNSRARGIAEDVARKTPPVNGSLQQTPARYIPRSYARKNTAEYWAEFFTYLREKERGLRGGYPCSRYFDPPDDLRQVARQIYAD